MLIGGGMEVNIADLTWSSFVYPRGGKNEKTVEAYVEAYVEAFNWGHILINAFS